MTIDRTALIDAISEPLSLSHGEMAAKLLAQTGQSDTTHILTVGKVVGAVLAELPESNALAVMDRMVLIGADVTLNGHATHLNADRARSHPALRAWIGNSAGDQIGVAIAAGMELLGLSVTAPVFGGVAAVQIGPDLSSIIADLHFPQTGGVVTLHFGSRLEGAGHRIMREMSGGALVGIGLALAAAGAEPEPAHIGEPPCEPPAAGLGTIH